MNKKLGLVVLFGCMLVGSIASAADIRVSDAIKFARHEVPRTCHLQSIEKYSDAYGIEFRDFRDFRNYIVYIDKNDGKPLARNMSSTNLVGSTTVNVSREDITREAFARYKNIEGIDIKLETEGKNNVRYRVVCGNARYAIDAWFNPATGVLGKEVIVYRYGK